MGNTLGVLPSFFAFVLPSRALLKQPFSQIQLALLTSPPQGARALKQVFTMMMKFFIIILSSQSQCAELAAVPPPPNPLKSIKATPVFK